MSDENLHYSKMVDDALRGVVRRALNQVSDQGLPGDHHFYLTFKTWFAGVQVPDHLRAKFDDEMTIVLQHQFENLHVDDQDIRVTLSFNGKNEPLIIPFDSLSGFFDPSVQFGLQFKVEGSAPQSDDNETPAENTSPARGLMATEDLTDQANSGSSEIESEDGSNVVTLDTFRKK